MDKGDMVFLDIETTGLEPAKCEIIEIGFCLVGKDFTIKQNWSSYVLSPRMAGYLLGQLTDNDLGITDFVKNMHSANGSNLFPELRSLAASFGPNNHLHPAYVFSDAVTVLIGWGVTTKDEICGSSLSFDRDFLQHHFSALNEMFHYRSIDTSSDMAYIKKHYPALWKKIDTDPMRVKLEKHRVISDIRDTVNLMHRIDKYVFKPASIVWEHSG